MIPKIIHYCWFGGEEKPADVQAYIASWHRFCPDFEFHEWNENNFDFKENQYCYEAFKSRKWAFVADYVRLRVLYEYGGIYMDTDVEAIKPMDALLEYNALVGYESSKTIQTGVIGACPKSDWVKMLLSYYDNHSFVLPDGTLDMTTNVDVVTAMTLEMQSLDLQGQQIEFGDRCVILPFDYLCAKDLRDGQISVTDNTYTIHHFSGSWLDEQRRRHMKQRQKYYTIYKAYVPEALALLLASAHSYYESGGVLFCRWLSRKKN